MAKNISNVWNFRDPLRCGGVKLAHAGREHYGTVIKSGFMKKTVTVRVNAYAYNRHYKVFINHAAKFQVHDEKELGRVGDKVVIRTCFPVSNLKHYYLKYFVWMSPRQNFVVKDFLQFEKDALLYNDKLRNKNPTKLASFKTNEML
jgi:ribosomal protein S17